jgi:hypothetical protein
MQQVRKVILFAYCAVFTPVKKRHFMHEFHTIFFLRPSVIRKTVCIKTQIQHLTIASQLQLFSMHPYHSAVSVHVTCGQLKKIELLGLCYSDALIGSNFKPPFSPTLFFLFDRTVFA